MKQLIQLEDAVIRFAGDSGDGIQLAGNFFSDMCCLAGFEICTFPDYPSEIRAPEGTLYGVSAFQVHFGGDGISTNGDAVDILVALNASSLKVNARHVKKGGIVIVDKGGFDSRNLQLSGYPVSPLDDGSLTDYDVIAIDFIAEIKQVFKKDGINVRFAAQVRNLFALGIAIRLFGRSFEELRPLLMKKFSRKPEVLNANLQSVELGWRIADKHPGVNRQFDVAKANFKPGRYRSITGNQAVALALVAAANRASLPLFLGSYPITPATEILQYLSSYSQFGVKCLQAEDEIAGITSAIGASFGGALAATTTSGPGLSLKSEALGLAVMTELPLIIINVQRAGPSTGLPTKPEQGDLLQAFYGRHGEAPLCILAAESPSDCFQMTVEAARIALTFMTPVIVLSDGFLGQSSQPWRIPDVNELPDLSPTFAKDPDSFAPYRRNPETLARMWAIPGIAGLEHRIGGLEKADITGNVSHDPLNHERMVRLRKDKIERISESIPNLSVEGPRAGEMLILSWGSTAGAARTAFRRLQRKGYSVSFASLRYLNPFPKNMKEVLSCFEKVVVPELNTGQLKMILKSQFDVSILGCNKVQGSLFRTDEIERFVVESLKPETAVV